MKRLLVFCLRDAKTDISVVEQVIRSLMDYSDSCVVVNISGALIDKSNFKDNISIVSLKGVNIFEAYFQAIYSKKDIRKYDEVVCTCDSLIGPLQSASVLFENVSEKESVWGIVSNFLFADCGKVHYIDGRFIVLRKNIYLSSHIFRHLQNLVRGGNEDVEILSVRIGTYFQTLGVKISGRLDNAWLNQFESPLFDAVDVMSEVSPFLFMEAFYSNYPHSEAHTMGGTAKKAISNLQMISPSAADTVWEAMLRQNISDVHHCLKPDFVLPSKLSYALEKSSKTALYMHLYYEDILDVSHRYAKFVPENMDLLITTSSRSCKERIEEMFSDIVCGKLEVRLVSGQGRSESAFLMGFKDIVMEYDYICFVHDKKTLQVNPASIGWEFWRSGMDGCLYSRDYIKNIIYTFDTNPRLGFLAAYPTNVGPYINILGEYEWSSNYEGILSLAKRLNLQTNIDKSKRLLAPFGSYFWFRTSALEPLMNYPWTLCDFPEEPLPVDGTLLHAIERIYPFVVQSQGYYSAYSVPDDLASVLLEDSAWIMRRIQRKVNARGHYFQDCHGLIDSL